MLARNTGGGRTPVTTCLLGPCRRPLRFLVMAAGLVGASNASAQDVTTEAKWEMDVHIGAMAAGFGGRGEPVRQWPASGVFAAVGGPTATTRAVSSWFFGDGAALFNQAAPAMGGAASIVPLDRALLRGVTRHRGGPNVGFSAARWLWPRLAVEVHGDYAPTGTVLSPQALAAIQDTTLTYADAWEQLLQNGIASTGGALEVSVSADADPGTSHQFFLTGGVKAIVHARRRIRTYVAVGLGIGRQFGRTPKTTIEGVYAFTRLLETAADGAIRVQFAERDTIEISVDVDRTQKPVGTVRGGVEYYMDSWRGFRLDVAALISPNRVTTAISARPSVFVQSPGAVLSGSTGPTIQFSSLPATMARSSLSGPSLESLVTFKERGSQVQIKLSLAYFFRF